MLIAYAQHHLGNLAYSVGDRESAQKHLRLAMEIYEGANNHHRLAGVLNDLAVQVEIGHDAAEQLLERSTEHYRAAGDELGALIPLSNLGYNAALHGDLARACQLLQRGLDDAIRLNHRTMAMHIAINLGHAAALAGNLELARICYINVLDVLDLPESRRQEMIVGVAYMLAHSQRAEASAQIFGALTHGLARQLPGSGLEDAMAERVQQTLVAMLSSAAIEEAMQRSRSLTICELDALLRTELVKPAAAF